MARDDSLYMLTDELAAVINGGLVVDEETGEIVFDLDNIEALEASVADKVKAVSLFSASQRSLAKMRKEAAQRMKHSADQIEKRADDMDEYVISCLKKIGGRIETPEATISIRKCPASVQVVEEWNVPRRYWKAKTTETIDKVAVKEALKQGKDVPGCALVVNEKLSIK